MVRRLISVDGLGVGLWCGGLSSSIFLSSGFLLHLGFGFPIPVAFLKNKVGPAEASKHKGLELSEIVAMELDLVVGDFLFYFGDRFESR